jgi:uncharacterized protein YraI
MRRIIGPAVAASLLVAPGLVRAQAAPNATAYATTALRVREAPSADAGVVGTIPRGGAVAVGACSARWCEVATGALEGHAARRYLTTQPAGVRSRISYRAPSRAGGAGIGIGSGWGYVNSAGVHVPSPTFTQDGRTPEGASARCRDGSYSFSMSRRGTCSHHGGVARWL